MRRLIAIVGVLCMLSGIAIAQRHEVGVGVGVSNFLGDLGRQESKGNWYINNLEASLYRPSFKVFYRYTFIQKLAFNTSFNYGWFAGDDRLAVYDNIGDDDWYRNYRNLQFRTYAMELSVTAEYNILRYAPGSLRDRITPYVFAGIGLLHFNPAAKYNGEWVRLRPLGTEGQGTPGYGNKYSLVQPVLPIGFGVKYNINRYWTVAFEFGHRYTTTDYIDDVSGIYVEKDHLFNNYDNETATMVYELSRRSVEIDPDGEYGYITEGGEYRGNPRANDNYLFSMFTVSYNISHASNGQYTQKKKSNPFAHKKKKLKKYRKAFKTKS